MKKLILIVAIFGGMLLFSQSYAQLLDIRHYNVQDGLIQSQVTDMVQDDDGFLWVATVGGASRFDGQNFERYTKRNGLAENYISCLFKDNKGRLWFGHDHGKLTVRDPESGQFKKIQISYKNKFRQHISIVKIYVKPSGQLWIATMGQGVFYRDGNEFHRITRKKNGLKSNYVFSMLHRKNGDFWFATPLGISILRAHTLSDSVQLDSLELPNFPDIYILYIKEDHKGGVWIGTANKGLLYYSPEGKIKQIPQKEIPIKNIFYIYETKDHDLWFLSYKNGAYMMSAKDWQQGNYRVAHLGKAQGLISDDVSELYEDNEHDIWFGYDGRGLDQLRSRSIQYYLYSRDNENKIIWSIWKDKKYIWFGLEEGLARYDLKKGKYRYFKTLFGRPLQSIVQIYQTKDKRLWFVCNDCGVFSYNPASGKFSRLKFPKKYEMVGLSSIVEDDQGRLWVGSLYNGLLRYDPQNNTYQHFTRKTDKNLSDSITVIQKGKDGTLWFGTIDAGLIRYDGQEFESFSSKNGYPLRGITNIVEDKNGNLWLLTGDDELVMFDGKKLYDFTSTSGLDQQALYSLVFWENELWIGTSRGIARLDKSARSFIHFGHKEGFKISECNERAVFVDADSNLWFGTINGAVKINPKTLHEFDFTPKIKITGMKIFLKEAKLSHNFKLRSNQNYLTFNYTGLYLKVPEWIRYQYKLVGFEDDWSPPVKDRFATYSYLPPGNYSFKVRASIDGEHWSESASELSFVITPPFYRTWWFILFAFIAIFSSVVGAVRYREMENKKARQILEQKVAERTLELQKEKEEVEKAFKALNESEKKFRTYTESTSSGIYIHQDNKFKFVNKAAQKISEYSAQELYTMDVWRLLHPDDVQMVRERFRRRINGDKNLPQRYEFRIVSKSGKVKWLDFTGRIINYEGRPAVLATVFDITDRKNAEQALMAEKERLSATLSAIADGVIAVNKDQKIILCNKKARNMLKIQNDAEALERLNFAQLFKVVDQKTLKAQKNPVSEMFASNGNVQIERTGYLIIKGNKRVLIEYSVAPIKDKESRLIGGVVAFRDITEKQRMENELLKSQKLESIGVLAGGIAHDFNNFLTAIIGNLSLMRMQAQNDEKLLQRIRSAEKAASRAQELTQQLLTFSKGGAPIKKHANLEELVRDSADFVLSGANVDYIMKVESDLWAVEVDAGQISQVIQNMIINANHAMPNGGTIHIYLKNFHLSGKTSLPLKEGKYVQLIIEDSGIGIPEKYLSRIFDPFFTTKQSGSGLGLATSFSIISKHDGYIDVKSEVGKGTRFTIYLPASEKTEVAEEHISSEKKQKKASKGGLILIMDDEEMIREIATELLAQLGYLTIHASDGKQALALYKKLREDGKKIDLVIMDLTIPGGMGGKETIAELLKLDPQAKAIVSSGYSNDPVMAQYETYGFQGCLQKPFRLDELEKSLEDLGLI